MHKKTFIIAEVGLNHNSNLTTAKNLIHAAHEAGVDACKFQVYWSIPSCEKYNFTKRQWTELFVLCEGWEIEWFCTPFDIEAVRWLDKMQMKRWKLPSNRLVLDNVYLLNEIARARNRQHTIISTGISNDVKIKELIRIFGNKPYTLLHCVSKYPTPESELNIDRISHLKEIFNCPVGFSDHSISTTAPLEAVKLGAEVIEKHITLDRNMDGPDHKASLMPNEFKQMVKYIRDYEEGQI
ncbi:MAG: N-acetylneuraminate synthase family protein [Promethearchaeota archaeon]